ncbi:hypothetical protein ACQPYE_28245 [Actinosynnema sp. CA-299493]
MTENLQDRIDDTGQEIAFEAVLLLGSALAIKPEEVPDSSLLSEPMGHLDELHTLALIALSLAAEGETAELVEESLEGAGRKQLVLGLSDIIMMAALATTIISTISLRRRQQHEEVTTFERDPDGTERIIVRRRTGYRAPAELSALVKAALGQVPHSTDHPQTRAEARTSLHRSIVVVDIEGYGDPDRTTQHRMAARDGLRGVMTTACAESGVPWDSAEVGDTGDGLLLVFPPEVPKIVLVDVLPVRIAAAVRRHNAVHAPEARFRLRMAVDAGELRRDGTGYVGQTMILAHRMLDAPAVKDALKKSTGTVVLVVSEEIRESVVRQDPGIDLDAFRPTPVEVKETSTRAWIRLVDGQAVPTE